MQTIVMISFLLGVPLWGIVADRFGRRPVILWCIVISFFCAVAQTLAPSYPVLAALRFSDNFFRVGSSTIGFVMAMEIVGGSYYRNVVAELFWVPWSLGVTLLVSERNNVRHMVTEKIINDNVLQFVCQAVVAYFFQDWRIFIPAFVLPSVALFSMFWLVLERQQPLN